MGKVAYDEANVDRFIDKKINKAVNKSGLGLYASQKGNGLYAQKRGEGLYTGSGLYAGEGLYAGAGIQREQFLLEKQIYGDIIDKPNKKSTKIKL